MQSLIGEGREADLRTWGREGELEKESSAIQRRIIMCNWRLRIVLWNNRISWSVSYKLQRSHHKFLANSVGGAKNKTKSGLLIAENISRPDHDRTVDQ